ncbi:MAG: hypothetical protein LH616_05455 [Ilumatobacteraceae bacterium]|nr:hypothetical protein [Ilumatobacteraceae bacterium]
MSAERILVVVDDVFDDPSADVPRWAQQAIVNAAEVHVIAPLMGSRLSVATDDQAMYDHAHQRLTKILDYMRAEGAAPTGGVVAASPLAAIETFLLDHDVDRIVVGVTAYGHWLEKDLLDKLREITSTTVSPLTVQNSEPD